MKQAILDTDTVSYFFRNQPNVVSKLDEYLREFGFIHISVVTYYEVLNGLYYKDAQKQLARFEQFINLNEVIPFNQNIAQKAAKIYSILRQNGQIIGHNDVLIAATAIVNDIVLITNNVNHFGRIDGLEMDNWAE